MALIAQETILEVKRSVDITEIISGYFPLKRAGTNYKALCPFHEEKTPSFSVHPERQTFKCFGCGKGGDAIGFVMALENVEYPDAIRILAERAGIPVKYEEGGKEGIGREDLYRVHEWARGIFRGLLQKAPEAEPARQFLARRGVNDETGELFQLGYSMDSWDHLLQRGRKAGYDDKILAAAGLVIEREGRSGCYDRFRGRAMFPIHDARGKDIAFGARTLKDEQPKFLNSPETAIFSKGRGFYGLHLAKEELERTRTVYIVEGYLDVVIPYQAGVRGLVATLGTALTREHLKVLRRYADKVVLVFDSDAAGRKASERGLDLLLTENVDIFVAELPQGMDPDDVVVKEGPDTLRACLEKPREIFDFLMESLSIRHGTGTPAAKARIVEEMLERVSQIPDPVKQEILIQQLSGRMGIEERTLRGKLARKTEAEEAAPAPLDLGPTSVAAQELLACALADAAVAKRVRDAMAVDRYPSEGLRRIAAVAYGLLEKAGELVSRDWLALLANPADQQLASGIVDAPVERERAASRAEACLETLGRIEARRESQELKSRLKSANTPEEQNELLRSAQEAAKKRKRDHSRLPGR